MIAAVIARPEASIGRTAPPTHPRATLHPEARAREREQHVLADQPGVADDQVVGEHVGPRQKPDRTAGRDVQPVVRSGIQHGLDTLQRVAAAGADRNRFAGHRERQPRGVGQRRPDPCSAVGRTAHLQQRLHSDARHAPILHRLPVAQFSCAALKQLRSIDGAAETRRSPDIFTARPDPGTRSAVVFKPS